MGSESTENAKVTGKVAVITGANAGLGFTLAEKLVTEYPTITLCLACRSPARTKVAADKLASLAPQACIDMVILDTSSLQSVRQASHKLCKMYDHIDYLYLNAGVMNVNGVDWTHFTKNFFSSKMIYMMTTGEGLLKQHDEVTEDGLQYVFATNVFGHYILVKELEGLLGKTREDSQRYSQLIWTSSSNGVERNFSFDDFQCKNGKELYGSSKYAMGVVSVGLNSRMNNKGVYSHSVCPGLMMTKMTYNILPAWFWTLFYPFLCLLRVFIPSNTLDTSNGISALMWLSHQEPVKLDPQVRFVSQRSLLGTSSVRQEQMKINPDDAEQLLVKFDELEASIQKTS